MFPLKFDLLFPSIGLAKEIARKFNDRRKRRPVATLDPCEARRIALELQKSRDRARTEAIAHRNGLR